MSLTRAGVSASSTEHCPGPQRSGKQDAAPSGGMQWGKCSGLWGTGKISNFGPQGELRVQHRGLRQGNGARWERGDAGDARELQGGQGPVQKGLDKANLAQSVSRGS